MPKIRILEYEGTDEQILKLLTQSLPQSQLPTGGSSGGGERSSGSLNPSVWDAIAKKFHKHVSDTADQGLDSQKKAMLAWLQRDGEIELTPLWKASGVKSQHNFGGVGGSLTKNMQKAGGPREWYRPHRTDKGVWIYEIIAELVEPLKNAFGVA